MLDLSGVDPLVIALGILVILLLFTHVPITALQDLQAIPPGHTGYPSRTYRLSLQDLQAIPPGPTGYPYVGNLLLLASGSTTETFRKLRRKYGDVFSLKLGTKRMVVVNGNEVLKEAFVKHGDVFSERPKDAVAKRMNDGKGIIGSSGDIWKHTRTFSLCALRELGFGKKTMESKVLEEVAIFLDVLDDKDGEAFSLGPIAQVSVSNVICSIVFGERYDHDDEHFKKLLHMIDNHFILLAKSAIGVFFPILRYLPGDLGYVERICTNTENIKTFLQKHIDKHKVTFDSDNIPDFIDLFLKEGLTHGESDVLDDANLKQVLLNLFVGGTDTTATTIKWAILFLLHHPNVQDKLRAEIDEVIGSSRPPSMTDKPEMTYTDAFIHETMRMGNIAPLALQHAVKHDTTLKGYTIRTSDIVAPNLDSVMFDKSLFEEPCTFNPERFIGEDGKLNGTERTVMAFALGRRVCLGESLARMELFLFVTSLIQRFKLLPDPDQKLPTVAPIATALSNRPHDFKFKAVKVK